MSFDVDKALKQNQNVNYTDKNEENRGQFFVFREKKLTFVAQTS